MAELYVHLVPLFSALPTDDRMQIEELVYHQDYQNGELVMDPASGNNLITVTHGNARLRILDEDGHEDTTWVSGMGDYADESWLSGKIDTNTRVEAAGSSDICLLSRNDFLALMKKEPESGTQLLEQNIIKVRVIHRQIQLLSLPKVEDRLLSYLQAYAKQASKNSFTSPLEMKDLALYLSTTPETLSYKFVSLKKQGSLKRKLCHIDLL